MDLTFRKATLEDVTLLVDNDIRHSLEREDNWNKRMIKELCEMRTEQFTRLILENTLVFYLAFDTTVEKQQRSFLKMFGFQEIYDEDNAYELSDVMEMQL